MKKYFLLFLAATMIIFSLQVNASNIKLISTESALVIDVVDGDAIVVRLNSGELAYIRLVGIDSKANNESITFLTSYILGKRVIVVPELSVASNSTRWNFAYVYLDNDNSLSTTNKEMINTTMLYKGFAVMNSDYSFISNYNMLASAQSTSRARALGLWDHVSDKYIGERININTASSDNLIEHMEELSYGVANNILEYRKNNPFDTVSEIKFVTGFTKELFDTYRDSFTVATSLNNASEYELYTLTDISSNDVNRIINYRKSNSFNTVSEVYEDTKISKDTYTVNLPFLSINERQRINVMEPDLSVNINTAIPYQISEIDGVTYEDAEKIVDNRRNTLYGYKNLFELSHIPNIKLKGRYLHFVADNFNLTTNINNAKDNELRSILGANYSPDLITKIKKERPFSKKSELKAIVGDQKYYEIEPFIYINNLSETDCININTATKEQIVSLNLSGSAVTSIINKQKNMRTAKDIPVDTSSVRKKISLYTNINSASDLELLSLDPGMPRILQDFNNYRDNQPFATIDEVSKFFISKNESAMFKIIEPYIVVR